MVRKDVHFKFCPEFVEALNEMVQQGAEDNKTAALENMSAHFIRQGLRGKVNKPVLESKRTPAEIFQLYADISKADRNVPGYKIHRHPKVGIIAVTIDKPDDKADGRPDDLQKLGEPELTALLNTPDSFLPPEKKQLIQAEIERRNEAE